MEYSPLLVHIANVYKTDKENMVKIHFFAELDQSFIGYFYASNGKITTFDTSKGCITSTGAIATVAAQASLRTLNVREIQECLEMVNSSLPESRNYSDEYRIIRISKGNTLFAISHKGMLYVNNVEIRRAEDPFFHIVTNNTESNRTLYSSASPIDTSGDDDERPAAPFTSLAEAEAWMVNKRKTRTKK